MLKKLEHVSDWNGGYWTVGGNRIKGFKSDVELLIGTTNVKAETGFRYGVDYDHSSSQNWKAPDLLLQLETPIGLIKYSLYDWMSDNDVDVYIKED